MDEGVIRGLDEANNAILEAATGTRDLTAPELRQILGHIAMAGFAPAPFAPAGGRLAGITWQGRVLRGSDRLPSAEVHYLRHVIARREWPVGTTLDGYLDSIRSVITDPSSGVLTSQLHNQHWQVTVVRQAGAARGPEGYAWVMVEYRVAIKHWVTAFQPAQGLNAIVQDPERRHQRWLRQPT
jgi:hypothetical protein